MVNGERASLLRRVAGLVAGVGALGLLLGGVATATIPTSTTGQVAACYRVSSGALRVIDVQRKQRCARGERLLTWGPSYVWRGAYNPKLAYVPGSVVVSNGSSYVARVAVPKGKTPGTRTGTAYWGLLAAAGATGPAGLQGPAGAKGDTGPAGPAGGPIPSGGTVTGIAEWEFGTSTEGATFSVQLPGDPGKILTQTDVNFSSHGNQGPGVVADADRECTGTVFNPTAPPGRVCLYLWGYAQGTYDLVGGAYNLRVPAFYVTWHSSNPNGISVEASWAYTAP